MTAGAEGGRRKARVVTGEENEGPPIPPFSRGPKFGILGRRWVGRWGRQVRSRRQGLELQKVDDQPPRSTKDDPGRLSPCPSKSTRVCGGGVETHNNHSGGWNLGSFGSPPSSCLPLPLLPSTFFPLQPPHSPSLLLPPIVTGPSGSGPSRTFPPAGTELPPP